MNRSSTRSVRQPVQSNTCSHQVSLELADDEVTNVRVKYFDTVPVAKVGLIAA